MSQIKISKKCFKIYCMYSNAYEIQGIPLLLIYSIIFLVHIVILFSFTSLQTRIIK